VWGITEASRKVEDVAAWSEQMGGFDALSVSDLHATTSPASILQLGIPVAMIDGQEATPERWADTLLDRLAA